MLSDYTDSHYELISDLGIAYKKYRRSLGLSQKEVHDKTGVAMSTISSFENGKGQGLSIAHFTALLDAVALRDGMRNLVPKVASVDLQKLWEKENGKAETR